MTALAIVRPTDPIEGGTANDYAYVTDPVNSFDLDGRSGSGGTLGRHQAWLCLRHPKRCATALKSLRQRALSATAHYGAEWAGGQRNAFRHACWMAMIAKRYGGGFARSLGKAHEKDTSGDKLDSTVDLWNNDWGIGYGEARKKTRDADLGREIAKRVAAWDPTFDFRGSG